MMRNISSWLVGGLLAGLLVSCGGEYVQPLGDAPGGSSNGNGNGNGNSVGSQSSNGQSHVCETECVRQILSVKATGCRICHDSGNNMTLKSAQLDLVSPGVTARLLNVPSKHNDITTMGFNLATDCPIGDLLIDSQNVESSWMLKKIRGQQGKCGDYMPSVMHLSVADQTCLESYIYCVAAN